MLFVILCMVGCTRRDPGADRKIVIRVDDHVLTLAEFNAIFEQMRSSAGGDETGHPGMLQEARNNVLLQLVEEMIIVRRAQEIQVDISPGELDGNLQEQRKNDSEEGFQYLLLRYALSYEAWKERRGRRMLVERVIQEDLMKNLSVSPREIKAYYDAHEDQWTHGDGLRAFHILLEDKDEAERILGQLQNGDDFSAAARLHSVAPEAESGGDMGWVYRGELPESLENPLFDTAPGALSPVVRSPFGFHIFKVTEKKEAGRLDIEDCIEEIKDRIMRERMEAAYGPWLAGLRKRYRVEVNQDLI